MPKLSQSEKFKCQMILQSINYSSDEFFNKTEFSENEKGKIIYTLLKQGKNLALVSDSGTPGVSDPGSKLVNELMNNELTSKVKVVPIPGPNAAIAAASISGFPMDKFIFMGFPPHKKGRQKFFKEISEYKYPVILYESPYRILKTLNEILKSYLPTGKAGKLQAKKLEIMVCRELTKKFETVYRGDIKEIINQLEKEKPRGEFVIVIKKS